MNTSHQFDSTNLVGEIQLIYKSKETEGPQVQLTNPEEVADLLWHIWDENTIELREEFVVVLLNNAKHCLGWSKISMGGKTATIVEVSQIVALAVCSNANSVILGHNHPSNLTRPSNADAQLTQRVRDALRLVGITLDDHIIITKEQFYSFAAHGQL
ncbi:JAB domain-containing protein [Gracilimonas sp. BCB1]|uniref:JAB domain-containing protein n=1 Tax=Gracilimonas sp. BCB1 TaxID=3152362 RepID=UPI0032D993EE